MGFYARRAAVALEWAIKWIKQSDLKAADKEIRLAITWLSV